MATFFKEDKSELSNKPVLKVNDKQKTELATGFFSLKNGEKGKKIIGGILDPDYNKRRKGKKTQGLKADEIAFGDAKKMVHDFEEIANENPKDPSYVALQPILKNVKDGIKKTRQRYGNMPQAPQPPKPPSKRSKTSVKPNTAVKPVKPNSITEKRNKKTVVITETQLLNIKKALLKEFYKGDLFHSTTLPHLYSILKENTIYAYEDCDGNKEQGEFVSLSRTGNPKLCFKKTKNPCIIQLNGDQLMSSIRNSKLKPHNFEKSFKQKGFPEYEERFYNNITPLSKLVNKIDIYIGNIDEIGWESDEIDEIAIPSLKEQGIEQPTDKDINMWFLNHILNDFPVFKDRIIVHGNI